MQCVFLAALRKITDAVARQDDESRAKTWLARTYLQAFLTLLPEPG